MGCSTCQNQVNYVQGVITPCIQCSNPECSTLQPCTEITDAACTIYTGENLICGINTIVSTNDSVAVALSKTVQYLCNSSSGAQSVQGVQGTKGIQGIQGIQGVQGIQSAQGIQGIQGVQGSSTLGTVGLFAETRVSDAVTNINSPEVLFSSGSGTLTVPANGFTEGDSYELIVGGTLSCANNEQLRIYIRSLAVDLAFTPVLTLPQITAKNYTLRINFTIRAVGIAGIASIATTGTFIYNSDSNNNFEGANFVSINNTTFDTTVTNSLLVTAAWLTSDVSNSINSEVFNLYKTF